MKLVYFLVGINLFKLIINKIYGELKVPHFYFIRDINIIFDDQTKNQCFQML